jgi:uncharacterized pyridoxal phosphate-dependent enzyme
MPMLTAPHRKKPSGLSRRTLFRNGGLVAAAGLSPGWASSAAAAPALSFGADMYKSIGVRPVINAKGTFTMLSGSLMLPECRQAMQQASRSFVQMDELMEAVGKRLSEITGAESAIVTCGCAAGLAHATAACLAGGDPEKIHRLPDPIGLKSEVVVPEYSRNIYDQSIRMIGPKIISFDSEAAMRSAINERTAMAMVVASPRDRGPLGLKEVASIAHEYDVPVLVDAAAEVLTIPNVHLQRGADLVAYSGGKALLGPQSSGLLIGRKDLIKAARLNSAPHHGFGRPMKVGKEDVMGLLAAVEMWVRRDHEAEWRTWENWLDEIGVAVRRLDGVTTEVLETRGLSNRSPRMDVRWDGERFRMSGDELYKQLYNGDPRIVLAESTGDRRHPRDSSVTVMPSQLQPGEAQIVGAEIYRALSSPPGDPNPSKPAGPTAGVSGQWDVEMSYVRMTAKHRFLIDQDGDSLLGTHMGETTGGDLKGWIEGNEIRFRSAHPLEGAGFHFEFMGRVNGEEMAGEVDLGEYGTAEWSAKRQSYDGAGNSRRLRLRDRFGRLWGPL